MITATELLDEAEHASGGTLDPRSAGLRLINEAGHALANAHRWPWYERSPIDIDLLAGQSYFELPMDFGQLVGLPVSTASYVNWAQLTSITDLQRQRQALAGGELCNWFCIVFPPQTVSTQAPPPPRFELYPTPTTTQLAAATVAYRARWLPLTELEQSPNIPDDAQSVLIELVRAYAQARRERQPVDPVIEPILRGSSMSHLKDRYGSVQPLRGMLRPQVRTDSSVRPWLHDSITFGGEA